MESIDGRATRRCLEDDLGLDDQAYLLEPEELKRKHDRLKTFFKKRAEAGGTGQEPIGVLLPQIKAFSLHDGRWRMATWFHKQSAAIWLLAVGYHRADSKKDAYIYFAELKARRTILPTAEDFAELERQRDIEVAKSFLQVKGLREFAVEHPGEVVEATLGGRIRVRVVSRDTNPVFLYVAVTMRLLPGELQLPADWVVQLAASFFPDSESPMDLQDDTFAGQEPRSDEIVLSDCVDV